MADYQSSRAEQGGNSAMKRKNKRKISNLENKHEEKASKSSRIDQLDDVANQPREGDKETSMEFLEDSNPWRNLQLVLSLQKKNIDIEKKVELAYKFVESSLNEVADDTTQEAEVVSFARVIVFLNNWVQSTLISSEKKIRVEGIKPQSGIAGSCFDYKCWKIFKFCLDEGLKLHVSMTFSRDILRIIHIIAKHIEIKEFDDEEFTLYNKMLECISSIFTLHGGVSNENLDLWVLLVDTVLKLVLNIVIHKLDGGRVGMTILNLTSIVLEPFTKFLRLHPNRKNGFHDFVDRLLEPLLCLMNVISHAIHASNPAWASKLLKLVEEVLSQGLFHPSHIDGFLSLQSVAKYKQSNDGKPNDSKTIIKSYHRHLFDKLERMVVEKKALALGGEGELLRLYVQCIKKQEGVKVNGGSKEIGDNLSGEMLKRSSGSAGVVSGKSHCISVLSAEIRKSLFDFFVQIMEPLLGEIDTYLQDEVEGRLVPVLEDVCCILKSTNTVIFSFIHEKVYLRVDDTSEGACANFLKLICDKITSLSAKVNQLVPSIFDVNSGTSKELLKVVARELILSMRHLLEIDYEVLGNDLESLWLLMFSYGILDHTLTDLHDNNFSIISEILHLGCYISNLYSELRQVGTSVFSLCKAVRRSVSSVRDVELNHTKFTSWRSSLFRESWAKSIRLILCSPEFRLSIFNAVKSIPEGQVSLCIQEFATDLTESLEWVKGDCHLEDPFQDLKAEVFGGGLSEVYALILDSLMVTSGNSNHVGVSLNALMAVIRPSMSILVSQPTSGVYEFLSIVSGRKFSNQDGCKNEMLSAHWFFLFFFRLYMSFRSLYRQAISLASPTTSIKMSEVMRDSFTAYSGNDWSAKTKGDDGYFSCIVQPSSSLLLIIDAISDICLKESMTDFLPLTYILNAVTLQRLVDLNRLIKSYAFLLESEKQDGTCSKQYKKWQRCVSKLKKEATSLTDFMMGHLLLLSKCEPNYSSKEDEWDFGVASINKKSLPSAFWCIICQNIDIWSTHAAKKKLKMFLSILFQNTLGNPNINFKKWGEHIAGKTKNLKTVTAREISLELLCDIVFYEEKFVGRHMASRLCRFLEESVSPLFSNGVEIKLQALPDWADVLNSLERLSVVPQNGNILNGHSIKESCDELEVIPSIKMKYTVCQNLLRFLCWMPNRCISSKSFSLYATCILNLERLIVGALLGKYDAPNSHDRYELVRLFLYCRKTLKHLMVTFCQEKMEASRNSLTPLHFGGKFPTLWLIKSIDSLKHAFSENGNTQVNDMMFSLMDYTSYVFLALVKGSFIHGSQFLISSREPRQKKAKSKFGQENNGCSEFSSCLDSSESVDASNFVIHVAETLKEHTNSCDALEFQKLSSIIACFQGFLWGISSTLTHMDARNINLKAIFLRKKFEPVDKIKLCIDTYASFINNFLCMLVLEDDELPKNLSFSQAPATVGCNEDMKGSLGYKEPMASNFLEKSFNLENIDAGSVSIKKLFLRSLLSGENLEAVFFLRQLFVAYSAILRLNLQIKTSLSSRLVLIFIAISEFLLFEFADKAETPSQLTFVLLDGIGKFLEELGNHFPMTNPIQSTKVYARLIDLHLKAIGKCISLQGKRATLESHETESSTKMIKSPLGFSECINAGGPSCLDELKRRLRMSFKVFVRKPSELQLSSAIQSIKRALVGVPEGCMKNNQICIGSSGGGKVSSTVAAGIDCFDLVLEIITGKKSLSMVKTDIMGLVCCLFNIILHLQGPRIFYQDPILNTADPNPGSAVLMCIELLTKVSGKHALYQMEACHVAQALSIPAALFQNVLQLTSSSSSSLRFSDIKDTSSEKNMNSELLDRHYSIELFAACCRMLCTFLRHHKRESVQHIGLLQDSVSVLLHCLEIVNNEQAGHKSYFVWEVQEGVKCASFLRRIYEEIRQQKDFLGQDCRLFLSRYIMVYSGYGPLKVGITREIDEALRPGIYALIDACSSDDLQYIHTVVGEGPCRSTLANLQHDYKLNFQYEGKV